MLIWLLLLQLLLPCLKITVWVQVSTGQPAPSGRQGAIVLGGLEPFLISTKQTTGSITLTSAEGNNYSAIYNV